MADARLVHDHDYDLKVPGPTLFECCFCNSSKHDPIQLNCLHYYCRSCFDSSNTGTQLLRSTVTCPACSVVTEISTVVTNSFLNTYKRACALRAEIVWCNTCEWNSKEETAEFWCAVCTETLCAACYVRHNKFVSGHRIFQLEHARTLPLSHLTGTVQCQLHQRPIVAHCFTCYLPKCTVCLDSCTADSHDLHRVTDALTQERMSSASNRVRASAQRLDGLLPGILQKCRAIASRLQIDRTEGKKMLLKHRRMLTDSTARVFDKSVFEIRSALESAKHARPDVSVRGIPQRSAENIDALALNDVRSLQLLVVTYLLKMVATYSCFSGRASNRKLLQHYKESGSVGISGAVSLTSDAVLSSCMGKTDRRRSTLRAPLFFREASVNFKTTVDCFDLAATRDGHVLLAAAEHGLLVYNDSGQQLSTWRPERQSDEKEDLVMCVAALSDGRATAGVFYARVVVLLTLSESGDTWLEDRRVAELQSPPWSLSVHGDLLAVAEARHDEQQQRWVAGPILKLLRLSSGQTLYTQHREYGVGCVSITALCVVTTSRRPEKSESGVTHFVLDAFSHSGQFLWRYETSDEEDVWGLCAPTDSWSRVYGAVWRWDGSSSRVVAVGGADGADCREVLSSEMLRLQLAAYMSVARKEQQTVLAVLSWDRAAKKATSVSLYEATG